MTHELILMEVSELNGIVCIIACDSLLDQFISSFARAHVLSIFEFDAVWFTDFSTRILINRFNWFESFGLSLICMNPRSNLCRSWWWYLLTADPAQPWPTDPARHGLLCITDPVSHGATELARYELTDPTQSGPDLRPGTTDQDRLASGNPRKFIMMVYTWYIPDIRQCSVYTWNIPCIYLSYDNIVIWQVYTRYIPYVIYLSYTWYIPVIWNAILYRVYTWYINLSMDQAPHGEDPAVARAARALAPPLPGGGV
jgi:hypothetical protein